VCGYNRNWMEHYLQSGRISIPNNEQLKQYIHRDGSESTPARPKEEAIVPPGYRDLEKKIDITPVVKLKNNIVLLTNVYRALIREIMVKYSFDIPKDVELIIKYASLHINVNSVCVVTFVTDMYDMLGAIVQQQTLGYELELARKPKLPNARVHIARGKKVKKHTK
jgi:hypothetical protein